MRFQLTKKNFLEIGFRLSIIATILSAAVVSAVELIRVHEDEIQSRFIWSALECASKYDDTALEKTKEDYFLYNITKLGCGAKSDGRPIFVSSYDIREARAGDKSGLPFTYPFSWTLVATFSVSSFLIINAAAVFGIICWLVYQWVIYGAPQKVK